MEIKKPIRDKILYKNYAIPLFEYTIEKIQENRRLTIKDLRDFSDSLKEDKKILSKYYTIIKTLLYFKLIEEDEKYKNKKTYKIINDFYESELYTKLFKKLEQKKRELIILNEIENCEKKDIDWTEVTLRKKTKLKKTVIKSIIRKFINIGFLVKDYTKERIIYNNRNEIWFKYPFKYTLNKEYKSYLGIWNYE